MLAIGTELRKRGHRVVVLTVADFCDHARAHGLEIGLVGSSDFPAGSMPAWQKELQKRDSAAAVKLTVDLLAESARVVLRDSPELVRSLGIDSLIVDQVEYAGSTLAESLALPYVTVANAFPLNREPRVPTIYSSWRPTSAWFGRLRDRLVYALHERIYRFAKVGRFINRQRGHRGLRPYCRESEYYSPLAQLSQCPEAFDYPRHALPRVWHAVGPLRSGVDVSPPFPFERLDGRPLVYASLGSMQGKKRELFAAIAEACAPLGVQLVITHGYQLDDSETTGFAGDPLVVPYAPQRALLAKASLVITHAGMNTVLDALEAGVPMVAIPVTFEQPAIAARVEWHQVGEMIPLRQASAARIRSSAARILGNDQYRSAAARLGLEMARAGGVSRAADVIEQALSTRQPVLTQRPEGTPAVARNG
jgi:zeaxanthin glucosyltransferase